MSTIVRSAWSGIESLEFGEHHYIQMGFRFNANGYREYSVQWKLGEGDEHKEVFDSGNDDNKRLAYSLYWEKSDELLAIAG